MQTVVFTGTPEEATTSLMAAIGSGQYGPRLRDQTWAGDRLIATFDDAPNEGAYLARIALGIVAGLVLAYAGFQMVTLRSVQGGTVAEAFDNYIGFVAFGLALLSFAYAAGAQRT